MTVPCSLANSTIYREIARRSARFYALRAASGADGSRPIPTFLPKKGLFLQTDGIGEADPVAIEKKKSETGTRPLVIIRNYGVIISSFSPPLVLS